MQTSSLFFRLTNLAVATGFFIATCTVFPSLANARKAEGRTRTSVHQSRQNINTRDVKHSSNINRNRDINRNANVNINKNVNVNVKGDRGYRYDGRHYHYDYHHHHDHDVGRAFAVGALTGLVVGTIVTAASMPPSCSSVIVNGIAYQQCGNTWYQPHYAGSQVNYIVVNPPR